jgi:hypothetical protein
MKETKIVHVKVFDALNSDVIQLSKGLNELKKKLDFNVEFILTNDKIEIHDIKYLIKELYDLYNMYKKLYESDTHTKEEGKKKLERREKEFVKQEIEVD